VLNRFVHAVWLAAAFIYYLAKVKWNSRLSGARLEAYREKKMRRLLGHAVRYSPFYRDLYRGIDVSSCKLEDLPITKKDTLYRNFDHVVTDKRLRLEQIERELQGEGDVLGFYLGRYKLYKTSGSTGKPVVFAYDKSATLYGIACNIIRSTLKWKQLAFISGWLFVFLYENLIASRRSLRQADTTLQFQTSLPFQTGFLETLFCP